MRSIYLLGFMGAGKTTVGRRLARRLALPFHDLDHLVVETDGRSIPQIFAQDGEAGFRALEARCLRELTGHAVVGLGGGAFIQRSVREVARERAYSVFLDVPLSVLSKRILGDPNRPLAKTPGALKLLYHRRRPIYRAADVVWRAAPPYDETPDEIALAVEAALDRLAKRS